MVWHFPSLTMLDLSITVTGKVSPLKKKKNKNPRTKGI